VQRTNIHTCAVNQKQRPFDIGEAKAVQADAQADNGSREDENRRRFIERVASDQGAQEDIGA
jgi:hypothetical protein